MCRKITLGWNTEATPHETNTGVAMSNSHCVGPLARLLFRLLIFSTSMTLSCERSGDRVGSVSSRGDTLVVTSDAGDAPTLHRGPVSVVFRDSILVHPIGVAQVAGDLLAVADRFQVHLLDRDGTHLRSFGGRGEGPGEFKAITGIGVLGDTLLVLDPALRRINFFSLDGEFAGQRFIPVGGELASLPNLEGCSGRIGVSGREALIIARSLIRLDQPTEKALARISLDTGEASVIHRVFDQEWVVWGNGGLVPKDPFGPRAMVALSEKGSFAIGDGKDPCVIRVLNDNSRTEALCHTAERVAVGPGIRDPDLSGLSERDRENYRAMFRVQEPSSFLPYFDRLFLAQDGNLWIGILGPSFSNIHPYVPQLNDVDQTWWAFGRDGKLTHQLSLPRRFSPMVNTGEGLVGLMPLSNGELVVASIEIEEWQLSSIPR